MKTSDLTGPALNWAVTKIELLGMLSRGEYVKTWVQDATTSGEQIDPYSTDWLWGGPIIEREKIELRHDGRNSWCAWIASTGAMHGPTPLIAAMRCYVASKLGDEVDIPKELL